MKIEVNIDETTYKALQNMAGHMNKPVGELVSMMLATSVKGMVRVIGGGGVEGLMKMADSLRQVEGVKDFEDDWHKAKGET
jgi:muramoyltetrapeptide carboxypeptidase LdcA involved in peptidoglycan recycling